MLVSDMNFGDEFDEGLLEIELNCLSGPSEWAFLDVEQATQLRDHLTKVLEDENE